jgi:hypothetical protein
VIGYAQIRNLPPAAKTLVFVQENNLSAIEELRGNDFTPSHLSK